MNRFETFALPATSRLYVGPEVPIPSLELPESHHKLFEPDMEVEPEKNATCVAVPDPDIVAVPVVSVSRPRSCHVEPL